MGGAAGAIPPKVREAMLKGDHEALQRMGRNGNRVLQGKKKLRKARLERGAAIFAKRTPARD